MRKALVTGSGGFLGSNLALRLRETGDWNVLEFDLQVDEARNQRTMLNRTVRRGDAHDDTGVVNRDRTRLGPSRGGEHGVGSDNWHVRYSTRNGRRDRATFDAGPDRS